MHDLFDVALFVVPIFLIAAVIALSLCGAAARGDRIMEAQLRDRDS